MLFVLHIPYVIDPKSNQILVEAEELKLGKTSISPSMLADVVSTQQHVGPLSMPCAIRASLPADNRPPNTI
jgi:hypothetical protein